MKEENKKLMEKVLNEVGYEPTNFGGKYRVPTLEIIETAINMVGEYYEKKYQKDIE